MEEHHGTNACTSQILQHRTSHGSQFVRFRLIAFRPVTSAEFAVDS